MRAALQLIHEYGIEPIEARVLALAEWAIACAAKAGFSVLGAAEGKGLSGIVSLVAEGRDVTKMHAKLEVAQVVTSLRYCRDGRQCLRLSPHFYNTKEEIAGLFAQI